MAGTVPGMRGLGGTWASMSTSEKVWAILSPWISIPITLLQGGSSHQEREDKWGAEIAGTEQVVPQLQTALQQAQSALSDLQSATTAAQAQIKFAEQVVPGSTTSSPPGAGLPSNVAAAVQDMVDAYQAAQAAATALQSALAQPISDMQAFQAGANKINPWNDGDPTTAAAVSALSNMTADVSALGPATKALQQATQAFSSATINAQMRLWAMPKPISTVATMASTVPGQAVAS